MTTIGDRLARGVVETHHGQHRIGRLGDPLRLAIAVEVQIDARVDPQAGGAEIVVGFEDRLDDQVGELVAVGDGFVEFAFAEARSVGQFDHGAVMRVAAADEDVGDLRFFEQRVTNLFHHGLRRAAAHVEADDRQLVVAGPDHDRLGKERIECSGRKHVVPGSVAPHRQAGRRRDVALAKTGLERRGCQSGSAPRSRSLTSGLDQTAPIRAERIAAATLT